MRSTHLSFFMEVLCLMLFFSGPWNHDNGHGTYFTSSFWRDPQLSTSCLFQRKSTLRIYKRLENGGKFGMVPYKWFSGVLKFPTRTKFGTTHRWNMRWINFLKLETRCWSFWSLHERKSKFLLYHATIHSLIVFFQVYKRFPRGCCRHNNFG